MRIREVKQMVQALHNAGIKVIMDVVYNHMFSPDNWFERSVPDYFLRRKPNGALANGSGCGCDMATERKMFRRFIVESVTFWAREYHMDGFRFDLMGLIDVDTMNAVRAALDEIPGRGRDILMYGEPPRRCPATPCWLTSQACRSLTVASATSATPRETPSRAMCSSRTARVM